MEKGKVDWRGFWLLLPLLLFLGGIIYQASALNLERRFTDIERRVELLEDIARQNEKALAGIAPQLQALFQSLEEVKGLLRGNRP